jgi:predicted ribosome quality control (RQC) complex YloA/Tae2 family protein
MKQFSDKDGIYKLGESALENWELIDKAKHNNYFFHLSSFPSGYVILETKTPTLEILMKAALLCKNGTKYRYLKDIKVDYCLCNNVIKSDKLGEVIFISNRKVKQLKDLT